ncbi:hypothetical protein Taro_038095 [Colocasia esculenta]|uniref:Uncharacterized protein n=1 Tax=Colocasia esculenta TaxID=4460 RepID=A0A843WBS8_COLES|nr:hypothetical protein [Colocasia esculenta]
MSPSLLPSHGGRREGVPDPARESVSPRAPARYPVSRGLMFQPLHDEHGGVGSQAFLPRASAVAAVRRARECAIPRTISFLLDVIGFLVVWEEEGFDWGVGWLGTLHREGSSDSLSARWPPFHGVVVSALPSVHGAENGNSRCLLV